MRKNFVLLGLMLGLGGAAAQAAPLNQALLTQAEKAKPEALALLERLVNIDSGTYNEAGLDKVGAIAREELKKLGARIEVLPATTAKSSNIVATWSGKGKGRILLVAHMDTVFGDGTAAARPFRVDGKRAYGPGIMDDKGGIVMALYAMKLLREAKFDDYAKVTLILNTNEETCLLYTSPSPRD